MSYLRAGVSKVDTTPSLGTLINGDFVTHYARIIHDSLCSKCLIIEDGKIEIAFIVVDICFMRKVFLDEVKDVIFFRTGIKQENILISSTHTHAAGSVEPGLLAEADLNYRFYLKGKIIESVLEAKRNLREAEIGFGKVSVPEHVVCRRYFMKPGYKAYNPVSDGYDRIKTNPGGFESMIEGRSGTPDPEVCYVVLRDLKKNFIGLLANYSMHYVGDWENGTITADYFSVFETYITEKLRSTFDFVGIMTNGTSGDANIMDFLKLNRYPKGEFNKSKLIGEDIAEKVVRSISDVEWEQNPTLQVSYKLLNIGVRKPSLKELETAKEIVRNSYFEHLPIHDSQELSSHTGKDNDFKKIYAREQVLLFEYPNEILFPVQSIRIGTILIGALAGEFFSETGLSLKRNAPCGKYFTICLANGYVGYVPPEHEFELGGYETWRSRGSFLAMGSEKIIQSALLLLMNKLFEK